MKLSQRENELINTLAKCENIQNAKNYYLDLLDFRKELLEEDFVIDLSRLLTAFSHIDRILILRILMEKDRCVCELESILGKKQSNISYHLNILEELDLIKGWKKGKFTHYSVVKNSLENFKQKINEWLDIEILKSNPNVF
jgi:ArsR family transcriptional regulator